MNQQKFELLKALETCSPDKQKFLERILNRASEAYDYAVERDAQSIQGELRCDMVTESQCTFYGKKNIGSCRTSGAKELYLNIHHEFRKFKTIKDFDWSGYGPESLYN